MSNIYKKNEIKNKKIIKKEKKKDEKGKGMKMKLSWTLFICIPRGQYKITNKISELPTRYRLYFSVILSIILFIYLFLLQGYNTFNSE